MSIALELTVFNKLFAAVAEEMGIVLRRSAFSPNIKERRDYSCAVFTAQGELLAQAAHIPVHLGALPLTMSLILTEYPPLEPGDVLLLNDPYLGGTHLPDLTLITPHYLEGGQGPAFYLINRAHHADVGGLTPGSMPLADDIRQEGVIIPPSRLYRRGQLEQDFWDGLLARMRVPEERQGDLTAQLAALHRGQQRLSALVERYGLAKLNEMSQALLKYSEQAMRALIQTIPAGCYEFSDYLDDDGYGHSDVPLTVRLTVQGDAVLLDFRESADQVRGGLNTVPAVVEAACYYVFLSLLPEAYPINQGCFRPIAILTRPGSILDAKFPAAVAAGNVETSQRLVDVVLGALAQALPQVIPAASQGTMNNLAFGGWWPENGQEFTYYETIGGGMGGSPSHAGLDGVHTHMTNTRNTPVEVIEQHYPVLVERYALREGSGGDGQHRGGQGLCRDFQFLMEVTVSLLTERRQNAPYGLNGGHPGQKGENVLLTLEGEQRLPGKINLSLAQGTRLSIRTPGGGGWGNRR
ncbi:MAG: hydantoinase B/oxoprolinase family protein [Deltaproteobacteria bacterium]|nr:hydantoinase B/oxoprolinase family protein [Deltaproteobacteria bacterium]MBW1987189.1 hydantoinase B/oxoprolinase family protein [Deltaproteobacteria bacterium]MBW2135051.1 hydantoinase B/oxoprolinase family protein [Deltaproteobacteria bacterium]